MAPPLLRDTAAVGPDPDPDPFALATMRNGAAAATKQGSRDFCSRTVGPGEPGCVTSPRSCVPVTERQHRSESLSSLEERTFHQLPGPRSQRRTNLNAAHKLLPTAAGRPQAGESHRTPCTAALWTSGQPYCTRPKQAFFKKPQLHWTHSAGAGGWGQHRLPLSG